MLGLLLSEAKGRTLSHWQPALAFTKKTMPDILSAYLITLGWAIVGSIAMGIGIILTLKLFAWSTREIDEWKLVKEGNIPIAIIMAAVIISLGIVVASIVHPG